ncbi:alpha/beta-hydrolase [Phaeosphaeriaceae sp. SRC1lsM3a]|nr:alpha/beta-hydrolase [Stagonospora sp. SRC1lsM3a]
MACLAQYEKPSSPPPRDYFYVGGEYINVTDGNITSQVKVGQIYVERLTPPTVSKQHPLVFIAGAGQTGTNFLDTPDGRRGWASFFLDEGYVVYLSDQVFRGRSPWHPSIGNMILSSAPDIEDLFTATSRHSKWPKAKLHTQWPGTGMIGDPTFEAFYSSQVQFIPNFILSEEWNTKAYSALLDSIGAAHVFTHSQSGTYGWRLGDARPDRVKSIVALEPNGPPIKAQGPSLGGDRTWGVTFQEVAYNPSAGINASLLELELVPANSADHYECVLQKSPAKQLKNLGHIPALVVTGEASFHAPYDYCTVNYLRQAGVQVDFLDLSEEGIHGNGHMFFMEKNNIDIAQKILEWLE